MPYLLAQSRDADYSIPMIILVNASPWVSAPGPCFRRKRAQSGVNDPLQNDWDKHPGVKLTRRLSEGNGAVSEAGKAIVYTNISTYDGQVYGLRDSNTDMISRGQMTWLQIPNISKTLFLEKNLQPATRTCIPVIPASRHNPVPARPPFHDIPRRRRRSIGAGCIRSHTAWSLSSSSAAPLAPPNASRKSSEDKRKRVVRAVPSAQ